MQKELRKIAPAELSSIEEKQEYADTVLCIRFKRKGSLNLKQDRLDIQKYQQEAEVSRIQHEGCRSCSSREEDVYPDPHVQGKCWDFPPF